MRSRRSTADDESQNDVYFSTQSSFCYIGRAVYVVVTGGRVHGCYRGRSGLVCTVATEVDVHSCYKMINVVGGI